MELSCFQLSYALFGKIQDELREQRAEVRSQRTEFGRRKKTLAGSYKGLTEK
jgi:hypothetical protein